MQGACHVGATPLIPLRVRTKFKFDFVTTATPDQVIELMTDFSPNRVHRWPASSAKAFEVYHLGETDADIREGQGFPKVWATWHLRLVHARFGEVDRRRKRTSSRAAT